MGDSVETALVAILMRDDSGLGSDGSDGADEKLLHGLYIHFEVRPSRVC